MRRVLQETHFIQMGQMDGQSHLICPRCRNAFLHSLAVRSFPIDNTSWSASTASSFGPHEPWIFPAGDNPSLRRQGLSVLFRCETCSVSPDAALELRFAQHKGMTLLSWASLSSLRPAHGF
jgi:hypothetical protein